jgi:hypothetical protein
LYAKKTNMKIKLDSGGFRVETIMPFAEEKNIYLL